MPSVVCLKCCRDAAPQACVLCRGALHILGSMCDSEARAPRGLNALAAGGGGGGSGHATALLACGMPSGKLVRETFSYAVNLCQVIVCLAFLKLCLSRF